MANRKFTILNLLSPISVILLLILRGTQLSADVKQPLGSRVRLKFPSAQVELGRQQNDRNQSQPNLVQVHDHRAHPVHPDSREPPAAQPTQIKRAEAGAQFGRS